MTVHSFPEGGSENNYLTEYIIDVESGAETARLEQQDILVTQTMGGVLPVDVDTSGIHEVLDVACGPGGWALEVAWKHPDWHVVGVDISQTMTKYAEASARIQGINNVDFLQMDILQALDFPDASVDLINARFLVGFMPRSAWEPFLQECRRILRPGGLFRWTECEQPITTSLALQQLIALLNLAFFRAGKSFSVDGKALGITPVMGKLMREAGYKELRSYGYPLESSSGTPGHRGAVQDWRATFQLVQPFLLAMNVTTQEELDYLYKTLLIEMVDPAYCGLAMLLSLIGIR